MSYAALYSFFARAFHHPPDNDFLNLARELPELEPFLEQNLVEQYSWLFEFNVYPYASVFLDQSGMLNGDWAGFVTGVYEALGLELSLSAGLAAADHLSAELEALAVLCERSETQNEVEKQKAEHGQRVLLLEHLLPWLPSFSFAVSRIHEGFYSMLVRLCLDTVLEHATDLIEETPAPTFHFPEASEAFSYQQPGDFKKKAGEAREQLQKLITPAHSGLFLSREDITQLGRKLDLPVRFAERPFMLENLVTSAADADLLDELFAEWKNLFNKEIRNFNKLGKEQVPLSSFWLEWQARLFDSSNYLSELV
ncbi:MAG: molecular chaperone TorD family protein [Trueperaceae bacterium]|nr:molecular chaperone TorD family protein [Trueperaceae bacterium]